MQTSIDIEALNQQIQIDKLLSELEAERLKEEPKSGTISTAKLIGNTPNPFSIDTHIKMVIPEGSRQADLILYNLEGKQLKSFPISNRAETEVVIFGSELTAGMYVYTLIVDQEIIDTKRLVLTR